MKIFLWKEKYIFAVISLLLPSKHGKPFSESWLIFLMDIPESKLN